MKTKNVKRILFNFIKLLPILILLVNIVWVVVASNQAHFNDLGRLVINDMYDMSYDNLVEYTIVSQYNRGWLEIFYENFLYDPLWVCFDLFFNNTMSSVGSPYYVDYSIMCISWFIVVSLIELFVNAVMFLPMYANKWLEGKL